MIVPANGNSVASFGNGEMVSNNVPVPDDLLSVINNTISKKAELDNAVDKEIEKYKHDPGYGRVLEIPTYKM